MRLEIEALGANELRCTIYLCVVVPPSLLDLPPELVRYMLQYLLLPSVALQRAATICKRMAGILCANEGHVARANRLVPMPVPAGSTALQQIAAFSSWHRQAGRWLNLARFYAEEQLIVQAVLCRKWQQQSSIDSPTVEQALLDVLPQRVLDDDHATTCRRSVRGIHGRMIRDADVSGRQRGQRRRDHQLARRAPREVGAAFPGTASDTVELVQHREEGPPGQEGRSPVACHGLGELLRSFL